jgi:hypothetical protein
MDAVWLLIGAALSTVSGVIFWFLNSRTTANTQRQQHHHELEMQSARLEAEKESTREAALRERKIARLQPAFDVLDGLETSLSALTLSGRANAEGEDAYKELWDEVVGDTHQHLRLPLTLTGLANRFEDAELRNELHTVAEKALHLEDEESLAWLRDNLGPIHVHLEKYAVEIDEGKAS